LTILKPHAVSHLHKCPVRISERCHCQKSLNG
jgi:hypothetical protein